jgi:Bacterial extracellular solute-binding proteins, family 5 Middle
LPSRGSPPKAICSGRNSPRAPRRRRDFPAIRDGRVKRDVIPDDTPSGAQGWFFNTRREKLKDKRLREAFIYAFDFEWTNKTLMYGNYKRTHSVFQNSDMMAVGKPSREELALLEPSPRRHCLGRSARERSCSFRPFPRVVLEPPTVVDVRLRPLVRVDTPLSTATPVRRFLTTGGAPQRGIWLERGREGHLSIEPTCAILP